MVDDDELVEFKNDLQKNYNKYKVYFNIWEKDATKVRQFKVTSVDENNSSIIYIQQKNRENDTRYQSGHPRREVLFKTIFGNVQYFSDCAISYDARRDCSYLVMDRVFYKGVSRSNSRVTSDQVSKIILKINKATCNCLDISAGGTSFVVNADLSPKLPVNKTFKDCQLIFEDINYVVPELKVVCNIDLKSTDNNGKSMFKIGIQFTTLDYRTGQNLDRQVKKILKELGQLLE